MKKIILIAMTLLSTNAIFAQTTEKKSDSETRKLQVAELDKLHAEQLAQQEVQQKKVTTQEENKASTTQNLRDDGKPLEATPVPVRLKREQPSIPTEISNPTLRTRK